MEVPWAYLMHMYELIYFHKNMNRNKNVKILAMNESCVTNDEFPFRNSETQMKLVWGFVQITALVGEVMIQWVSACVKLAIMEMSIRLSSNYSYSTRALLLS